MRKKKLQVGKKNARLKPVQTKGATGGFFSHSLNMTVGPTQNYTGIKSNDYDWIDYSQATAV